MLVSVLCRCVLLWEPYPRQRRAEFVEPHAHPLIQKRSLDHGFRRRGMSDQAWLGLSEEMICHGCAKDAANV